MPIWDQRMLLLMRHCVDTNLAESQKDFLVSIGMSPSNMYQIKQGSRSFTINQIVAAAKKYKVNINWICGLDTSMKRARNGSVLQNLKDSVREIEAMWTQNGQK